MVKLIKHVYRCIKIKQSKNSELNETLIDKNEPLFELSEQDDYSTYENNNIQYISDNIYDSPV